MKVKFEHNRLVFLEENTIEETFIADLIADLTESKKFTGYEISKHIWLLEHRPGIKTT